MESNKKIKRNGCLLNNKADDTENVNELLERLRQGYGVYIGKKSLEYLIHFVGGYIEGIYQQTGIILEFLPGFQDYIANHYHIHDSHHWSQIITFYCLTDEEAFDEFYKHYDSFCTNKVKGSPSASQ